MIKLTEPLNPPKWKRCSTVTFLKKFWRSVKRNPVINVFVVGVLAQALNHAIEVGDFGLKNIAFYAFQLALAAIAREFVVPLSEHNEMARSFKETNSGLAAALMRDGDE